MNASGKQPPAVSVIVPCYNASRTIASCLDALANQTLKPAEIIVVDDAGTDDSGKIAERAGAKVVRLDRNRGAATARNAGAAQASSDVLLFVDSDVFLHRDALEKLAARFGMDDAPDAVIGIYSPRHPELSFVAGLHNMFTYYNHDREEGKVDWFWGAIGAVKKQTFADLGGFDEKYRGANAEDIEFGWRMARAGKKCVIAKDVLGDHHANLTFANALRNDFRKGTYAIPFMASHNRKMEMQYGFMKTSNYMSLTAAGLSVLGVLLAPLSCGIGSFIILAALAMYVLVNFDFFRFTSNYYGASGAALGALVHFIFYLAIGFGIVWGGVEYLRGKPT